MKKIATTALIALTLAGCGILPGTTSSTTATTTTKSSLLSILGLDEATDSATESADPESGSASRVGPAQLLFVLLDADENGKVTLEEMSTALAKYATIDASKLEELFGKMDRNGDGSLVLSEMQPERQIEHRKPPRHHGRHHERGDRPAPMDDEGSGEEG